MQFNISFAKGYILGNSKCKTLTVPDLYDAYHRIRLSEKLKQYCGFLPYFGSTSCLYQRMPMDLNVSPALWQTYVNALLENVQIKNNYVTILDDLSIHSTKKTHKNRHEELQYRRNTVFVEKKRICFKPMRCRLEAIQKLKPPPTLRGCKSFGGQ